jgi:hypothetical protein
MENLYGRLLVLSVARGNSVRLGLILSSVNSVVLTIKYIAEVLIVTIVYIYILNLFPQASLEVSDILIYYLTA